MAPMSSTEVGAVYGTAERRRLLELAARSIEHGLERGAPLSVDPQDYPETLQASRATFVTLEIGGQLRGCIGVLQAFRPLVVDVAQNAYAAAFEDPRFPGLQPPEFPRLEIHISVLSPAEPLRFASENDLLRQIRPGIDGLILQDRAQRGTFLPSVWEQLPGVNQFFEHLKRKAGLPFGYWSDTLQVARYTTESFGTTVSELFGDAPVRA